jgi:hypothetical protein
MLPAAGAAASSFDRLRMKLILLGDATKTDPHAEPPHPELVEGRSTTDGDASDPRLELVELLHKL